MMPAALGPAQPSARGVESLRRRSGCHFRQVRKCHSHSTGPKPQQNSDGTFPKKDDYRLNFALSFDF